MFLWIEIKYPLCYRGYLSSILCDTLSHLTFFGPLCQASSLSRTSSHVSCHNINTTHLVEQKPYYYTLISTHSFPLFPFLSFL